METGGGDERRPGHGYDPRAYWSERLAADTSLRSTGHLSYSAGYNAWLYRAKRRVLRGVLADLRFPLRALDVGSGTGWVVSELIRLGAEVEGCDIAEIAVERLEQRFPGTRFFRVELGSEPIPRPDSSYKLITALDVLYHVTDDGAWANAVRELARVLELGGRLIVTDGLGADDAVPASHVRFRSMSRWLAAGRDAGLRLERTRPLYSWLSRDVEATRLSVLPGVLHGAVEYLLERVAPRPPHMRCAVLVHG